MLVKRLVGLIVMGVLATTLLTGCVVSEEEATAAAQAQQETDRLARYEEMTGHASPEPSRVPEPAAPIVKPNVPMEYSDAGNGLGYRFVSGTCDFGHCSFVELLAYEDCPSGVYVEGNTLDSSDRVVGLANDILGGLSTGDIGLATLQYTDSNAVKIELTEVSCY